MRLIDVDKLPATSNVAIVNGKLEVNGWIAAKRIEEAPTVNAIPIEWIEKYAKRFIELENRNYFAYRGFSDIGEAILNMLENWEKENENR